MTDIEWLTGAAPIGHVQATWTSDGLEITLCRPDGSVDAWRVHSMRECAHGHQRSDGVSFGETSLGEISERRWKAFRRTHRRRSQTPVSALRALLETPGA